MILKLAWRNIGRNRRRTAITIAAVAFATLIAIATRGLQLGTYKVTIDSTTSLFTGYMQIQKPGFKKNPSLRKSFTLSHALKEALHSTPYVKAYAPRIYADGLVALGEKSFGIGIFGISPEMEQKVTTITNKLSSGRFFGSDSSLDIVVGETLFKNLGATLGDQVVILSQAFDGTMGNMRFRIVGTIKTGAKDIDRSSIFMGLRTSQELLSMGNRISVVSISMTDGGKLNEAKKALAKRVEPLNLVCLSWDEILPELKNSIDFDNISGALTVAILVVVVAFGILNTVLMSVTERFREFGILLSIGMPNGKLALMVLAEGVLIAMIGIAIGVVAAIGVNYYFEQNPITFSGKMASLYEEYGFIPVMKSTLEPKIFLRSSLVILLISLIAVAYPVLKVKHLMPLKGIRYT